MKKSIVRILIFICLCFLLLLCGCGTDNKFSQKGLEISTNIKYNVNSDEYRKSLNLSNYDYAYLDQVFSQGGNSSPSKIFKITFPEYNEIVSRLENINGTDLTSAEKDMVLQSFSDFTFMTQLLYGKPSSAVYGDLFSIRQEMQGAISSSIGFLYLYDIGKPTMVTFSPGDNGIIIIIGKPLFVTGGKWGTLKEIQESLSPLGATVTEMKV